jgi:tRNA (guanine-N7-)-methyltransferase
VRHTRRLPLEDLQTYLVEIHGEPALLNLEAIFGNDHPVELEVGFGKGMFLVSAPQANPDINYLGIEIERAYQLYTANRLAKRRLMNVRLACGDARAFLRDYFPDGSLEAVHVYFPDPWWKQRHRKRRLFSDDFADHCARVLRPAGQLHVVSDVAEYFRDIQGMLARQMSLRQFPVPDVKAPGHDLDYLTNFERKYRKEGKEIYRGVWMALPAKDLRTESPPAAQ